MDLSSFIGSSNYKPYSMAVQCCECSYCDKKEINIIQEAETSVYHAILFMIMKGIEMRHFRGIALYFVYKNRIKGKDLVNEYIRI